MLTWRQGWLARQKGKFVVTSPRLRKHQSSSSAHVRSKMFLEARSKPGMSGGRFLLAAANEQPLQYALKITAS